MYLVGGFFGFIKKAFKRVARVVGKIGGTALGVASVLVPGPAGRLVAGISGKLAGGRRAYARASATFSRFDQLTQGRPVIRVPGLMSKQSTVMPGGSLAMRPVSLAAPARRKRRKPAKQSTARRRTGGRKLKFGSPAWRKKYMKRRR